MGAQGHRWARSAGEGLLREQPSGTSALGQTKPYHQPRSGWGQDYILEGYHSLEPTYCF